ncbi:RING finger protein 37 [Antennarius striatus]|uniref:RING finger protein 37 n=1 Tax=Antennarius striatus TaxID=241820 RepID=UPI0035B08C66
MVVNLCLPHFKTTVHCNKLCADGYDVTNLVSADPVHRKRGFKLEYFLRPPVQVTLKFDFQVEVCRVDVELWPWGMDRGQACKRLEVSTSCDGVLPHNFDHSHKLNQQKEHTQMQSKFQNKRKREKEEHGDKSSHCNQKSRIIKNGDEWSIQACQWGDVTQPQPQQMGHMLKCQSQTVDSYPEPHFRLVGRCELKEETQVCFTQSNFRPRPPFLSSLPPQPPNCLQEVLWNRGLLGAVTQLRVTMPFGGAASALGFKALAVWGQPARCCAAEEVERIKRVHEVSSKLLPSPAFYTTSLNQTKPQLQAGTPLSNLSIPEEFLDPITQEIMTLPMLLPSGVSVDNTTLEKHQKREATWGRPPNDPFTGVPFTSTSNPLPNPQLKSRIDHFLLQNKVMRTDRVLGRQGKTDDPQSSRLIASKADGKTQSNLCLIKSSKKSVIQCNAGISSSNWTTQRDGSGLTRSESRNHSSNSQHFAADLESRLKKENINQGSESSERLSVEQKQRFQAKRPRNDAVSFPSCSSHEQRLSASLDEALFSALQGRPSFTSNLSHQRRLTPDPERPNTSKNSQIAAFCMSTGEKRCSSCFCSLSIYSQSTTSVYRLTCGHLLCRCCLQKESQPLSSVTISTSNHISCPACQCPTPCSDIIRVHH